MLQQPLALALNYAGCFLIYETTHKATKGKINELQRTWKVVVAHFKVLSLNLFRETEKPIKKICQDSWPQD
jgi:hypothetical protein